MVNIKNSTLKLMRAYFGEDKKRIKHAEEVLYYACGILKEEAADEQVVVLSAILHDIGIKESEKKYNSSAPKYQHIEGPPVARSVLEQVRVPENVINEVCDIIGHHHTPRENETQNFKVLSDADWIVNIKEEIKNKDSINMVINKYIFTETGKEILKKMI